MSGDRELELLKRRRRLELQKRLLALKAEKEEEKIKQGETEDPEKILNKVFTGRAQDVLNAAKRQFPQIVEYIEKTLARLVLAGEIKGPISGEQLLWFFRNLGLNVRLETRIRILESGELKTLAEKLKE